MNVILKCNKLHKLNKTFESNAVHVCVRGLMSPKEEIDILSYTRTDHEYKIGKLPAGRKLAEILNLRLSRAVHIATEHKILHNVTVKLISENYDTCKQFDISNEIILAHPYILGQKNLADKIVLVQSSFEDINTFAPLLKLEVCELQKLTKRFCKDLTSRTDLLSNLLKVPKHSICYELIDKRYLLWQSLSELKTNIIFFLEYGFTCDEIFENLLLLEGSPAGTQKHFDFQQSAGSATSGNYNLQECLVAMLECSYKDANVIIQKEPILTTVRVDMVEKLIDTLIERGFTPYNISKTPKILTYYIEIMR